VDNFFENIDVLNSKVERAVPQLLKVLKRL